MVASMANMSWKKLLTRHSDIRPGSCCNPQHSLRHRKNRQVHWKADFVLRYSGRRIVRVDGVIETEQEVSLS